MKDGHIKKRGIIQDIVNSDDIYSIVYQENVAQARGGRIEIDPFSNASTPTVRTTKGRQKMPYEITLAHELGHGYSFFKGFKNQFTWFSMIDNNGDDVNISFDENWAMHFENYFRSEMGLPLRTHYNELNKSAIFNPMRFVQTPVNTLKSEKPIFRSPRNL